MSPEDRDGADEAPRPGGLDPQDLARALGQRVAANNEAIRRAATQWSAVGQRVAAQMARTLDVIPRGLLEGAAELTRRLREALPPNWRRLDERELDQVFELARDGEFCLVWIPSDGVLREVLAAPDAAGRERALVEARRQVLADVAAVVDEAASDPAPVHAEIRGLVQEALTAADACLDRAAQVLLASALSRLLHDTFGFARLGAAFKAWRDEDLEDVVISELRFAAIQRATVTALIDTEDARGGFNRHGTQHGDPKFLDEGKMLAGFLLLAAWVRELAWLAEHFPEEPEDDETSGSG